MNNDVTKLVILESPYAGDIETNLTYLRACMRDSVLRGESPYASHGLLTQPGVLDDDIPDERTMGINAGFEWHKVADYMVVYTDLGVTPGMQQAMANAVKTNLKVVTRSICW